MAGKKNIQEESSSWAGGIEKYSRQIWLAGLGAYSKISNDGSKLFENLVKDGEKAEKQVKEEVDDQVDSVKAQASSAKSRVGDVKDRALGKWGELEEAFDKRLNSAISRLGVPSRNEVRELHSKVDALTRQIEKLTGTTVKSFDAEPAAVKPKPASKPRTATAKAASAAQSTAKAASKPVAAAKSTAKTVAAKAPTAVKAPAAKKPAAPRKPAAKKPVAADASTPPQATAPAPVPEAANEA